MNRAETMTILSILKGTYPNFYKQMDEEDINDIVNVWAMMFENEPAQIVTEAIKALIQTLKFPPTIADVKEKISLITEIEPDMSEVEAWNIVKNSISIYNAGSCFNNLPPLLKKLVGSPNQLREWAMMDSETLNTVTQSNFMRSYRYRVEKEKEMQRLPESTKALIQTISEKMTMLE